MLRAAETAHCWSPSICLFDTRKTHKLILCSGLPVPSLLVRSHVANNRCHCYDLYSKNVPYLDAWKWQKDLVKKNIVALEEGRDVDDTVILLQHPPVYTLGTRSSEEYLLFDKDKPPCELYRIERGGEVTYHGPGQLVMYPILNLRHHHMDLHWYIRSLEEVVIRSLWSACNIKATRVEGLTGVWVGEKKVAAIGVRVSRWITYHGLALNAINDLSPFDRIVPCGIRSRSVGSVWEILQDGELSSDKKLYSKTDLLDLLHQRLLAGFSEVFGLEMLPECQGIPFPISQSESHV